MLEYPILCATIYGGNFWGLFLIWLIFEIKWLKYKGNLDYKKRCVIIYLRGNNL